MAYATYAGLAEAARARGSLGAAALAREVEDSGLSPDALNARMGRELDVMASAIAVGLAGAERSRSGLTGGDAARVMAGPSVLGPGFRDALASAIAVGETNARMGRIVAAPTAGASGVVPAVLLAIGRLRGSSRADIISALFAAGAVGAVIAARATLSGAAGGCQAEIGAASAMSAAAAAEMMGADPETCGHAASLALQGQMGLVCDPVGGLVELPCVMRNATGTAVAFAAIEMALAGVRFPIPLDEVIVAMGQVGRSLPPSLRETALGGLAATPTGRSLGRTACTPYGSPAPDRDGDLDA
ncbi:MAG: L-serine ammonia-lyase, iron-sulfur-dependent, subunit alpha [Actinomycetota bacterium]|nr:L-serine ammonia-lyase, iron-sulfur-dependent, subunit alpha [Actinomycetota bacterium]